MLGYRRSHQIRAGTGADDRMVLAEPQTEIVLIGAATVVFALAVSGVLLFAW